MHAIYKKYLSVDELKNAKKMGTKTSRRIFVYFLAKKIDLRELTCGSMVRRAVVPSPRRIKLRFDALLFHKGRINFQWEAKLFMSITQSVYGDFVNLKTRRLSLTEVHIGVECVVHRGECMYVFVSVCVFIVFLIRKNNLTLFVRQKKK
jgi:hypothetical protein